ncbi:MAG: Gldg family protein, partial [Limisphaerales bacterium]
GQPSNPMMQRMGQQGQEPWVFVNELKRDFDVKTVPMTADKIEDAIKVLMVIHPKEISETAQYAIDQFILRGGKLIAFLDPNCYFDQNNQNPMMGRGPSSSTLEKLLKVWGLQFDIGKVVADRTFSSRTAQGPAPAVLSLTAEGVNKDDIVTGQIDNLLIPFPGAFSGEPVSGLKKTVLLKTTKNAQLVDGFMAQLSGEQIEKEFKSGGQEYPLAVRLTGKFKTAFPDGKPKEKADEKPDAAGKKEPPKPSPGNSLKESSAENVVLLIGDADLLNDAVSVEIQQFFNQRIVIPRNGNLTFTQSAVEQLAGDSNLISVRSRATLNRPFTRVKKMETQAQETFQNQIHEMQTSLAETQRRLSELQQN